jgi:hypothetical protein
MNIEEKIKEQRTFEATAKNLMGMEGKFYCIARFLGDAITTQSTDQTFLESDDFWSLDTDELPSFSDEEVFSDIGYVYNGLSDGIHLEIICKEAESSIKVFFEGYLYYEEDQGSLLRYYPYPILEKHIENLYNRVEEKVKYLIKKEKPNQEKQIKKMEFDEIRKLREKWGNII